VHPNRDLAWYEAQKRDSEENTGSLDALYEQYPETDEEALSARMLDKRIAIKWLKRCYRPRRPIDVADAPAIPGLRVYAAPEADQAYVVALDPAEGNPTSDESSIHVLNVYTGEECAVLAGLFEPSTAAAHASAVARWYRGAAVLVERNNHGHTCIQWLQDEEPTRRVQLLKGPDKKVGWLSTSRGKALMYDACADALKEGDAIIHDEQTYTQLASIEGSTLRAPEREHDDRATSFALGQVARGMNVSREAQSVENPFYA
jgi:hypothetical protein